MHKTCSNPSSYPRITVNSRFSTSLGHLMKVVGSCLLFDLYFFYLLGMDEYHQYSREDVKYPHELIGMSDPGGAALPRNFCPARDFLRPARKQLPAPPKNKKNIVSCILEGRLTTNPILSALHLQSLKSNIYVHFHQVNKPLIGISF